LLLVVPLLALDIPSPPPPDIYIKDMADAVDAGYETLINDLCREVERLTTAEMAVLTVSTTEGEAHWYYATKVGEEWGVGPGERGKVTADLVKEVRARLDLAGFKKVGILVSGGIDLERISYFLESGAPVDGFGIGSYISGAKPIDFTADLHEVEGKPIAKRGRIPGITPNPRLKRIM